jgi:hypothetical protein
MATVRQWLNDIEQTCMDSGKSTPDRQKLLNWMSLELQELTTKLPADWFIQISSPVTTANGTRGYNLPSDFGTNFLRHGGQRFYQILNMVGDKWVCLLNDGTKESLLGYESPAQFYSKNLLGEAEGRPSIYTITTAANGTKQLQLSTKPDTNGGNNYTVYGPYQPTNWSLASESTVPAFPANSPIMKYAVLRRLMPATYEPKYKEALADLMMMAAQERVAQFTPVLGRSGKDEYSLQLRRF